MSVGACAVVDIGLHFKVHLRRDIPLEQFDIQIHQKIHKHSTYTENPKKLAHLSNILQGPREQAEVPQHDATWISLMSDAVL